MSVRKIRNSWWVDFRHEGRRHRIRSPENSHAGAKAYEAVVRGRLVRGESAVKKDPVPTYAAFATQWFTTYVVTNNKHSEVVTKSYALKGRLVPWFGGMELDKISAGDVERYKAVQLASGLAPKTVNNHLGILGKSLRTAQDWGLIEKIPRMARLRVPPQPFDFLAPEEIETLLQSTSSERWRAMVFLAARTGMRLGELCALHWDDVDLSGRVLTVRRSLSCGVMDSPKSNRIRKLPLTDDTVRVLSSLARGSAFVFNQEDGSPLTGWMARKELHHACKAAGIRRIGWHALRHTFASHLSAAGAPLRAVQELLGHSTIQMTMRYTHVTSDALRSAVELLSAEKASVPLEILGNRRSTHSKERGSSRSVTVQELAQPNEKPAQLATGS